VAISERINGAEELVIVAEVDERKFPADAQSGDTGAKLMDEFWALAVRAVQGAVSTGHGLSVRSVVFVEPRSLEKTSSGKPRRQYYQQLFLKGELAVLHEKRSPHAV